MSIAIARAVQFYRNPVQETKHVTSLNKRHFEWSFDFWQLKMCIKLLYNWNEWVKLTVFHACNWSWICFCTIFSYILLVSNSMVSRAIWETYCTLVNFSKISNCTRPSDSCKLDRPWKIHSRACFFPQIAPETILLRIQIYKVKRSILICLFL
jgi:hypothetical protein